MYAKTGGFKEVHDRDDDRLRNQTYTGVQTSQKVKINFDLETPYHCSATQDCALEEEPPVDINTEITMVTRIWLLGFSDIYKPCKRLNNGTVFRKDH